MLDYRDGPNAVSAMTLRPATDDPALLDDDAPHPRRRWRADAQAHGVRLDKVLSLAVPEYSRNHLQALMVLGHVQLDQQVADTPSRKVRAGQLITLELVPTAQSQSFKAEALPLAVVHEDDDLMVIDKVVGMVVHPAAGHWSGTLLNAVLAHHPSAFDLPRAGIVHRLDKDTSGLMVVAKTLVAMTALVRALAARDVSREYVAIARGTPVQTRFSVDAALGRDPVSRIKMAVRSDGKPARTDVEVVGASDGFCALRCKLHSGRTHQIRVHLASRGLPLVGDALYGGVEALGMQRQALHAVRLGLVHPSTGRTLTFVAPPPTDFADAWQRVMGV